MQNLRYILLAIVGFIVLATSVDHAEGLECYQCAYVDLDDSDQQKAIETGLKAFNITVDDSCKTGKKPKSDYVTSCGNVAVNTTHSCVKMTVDEKVNDIKAKLTVRGCFPTPNTTNITDTCGSKTLSSVIDMSPTLGKSPIQNALLALRGLVGNANPSGNTCFCQGEKCNSAFSLTPFNLIALTLATGIVSYLSR